MKSCLAMVGNFLKNGIMQLNEKNKDFNSLKKQMTKLMLIIKHVQFYVVYYNSFSYCMKN